MYYLSLMLDFFMIYSVKAYDSTCIEKGPVFRIPITLVQPVVFSSDQERKELSFTNALFKPSQMQRHYILVPENATWAGMYP